MLRGVVVSIMRSRLFCALESLKLANVTGLGRAAAAAVITAAQLELFVPLDVVVEVPLVGVVGVLR